MNELTPATPAIPAIHPNETLIKSHLPAWMTQAPSGMREVLRKSLINHNQSRHQLKGILDQLKSPEAFARPFLQQALSIKFHGLLDAEQSVLVREWKTHHLLGQVRIHTHTTEHSLLDAALQNFEASETEEDGMETGSGLHTNTKAGRVSSPITALMFAAFCRSLDLGRHYQQHLSRILTPVVTPETTRSAEQVRKLFADHEQNRFDVALHVAYLRGDFENRLYQQLLTLQRDGIHPDILCNHLTINGVVLPSVLVIRDRNIDRSQILYTPEDPIAPFRRHPSMDNLVASLADRLEDPQYLKFFNRLTPLQHQGALFTVKPAWVDSRPLGSPLRIVPTSLEEPVTRTPIEGDLFQAITQRRIEQIKSDARVLAVPTADTDAVSRQKRLQRYADIGKSLLFFATSFIPIVGEVLLVVSAGEIIHSIYNGFAAWSRGESDLALNELMDAVDSAAEAAISAGVIKTTGFTAKLVKVNVRNQGWRLWKADLLPYRHLTELPGGLPADTQGLHFHEEQHYVKLDDHVYAVQRDALNDQWQLQHPSDPQAYTPTLLSNSVGGWRQEHESPKDWDNLKLIKRLGPDASNIAQEHIEPILLLSGVDAASLRQGHQNVVRPAPLLRDTLKRFNLAQEINNFDANHAEGKHITPFSPLIQFHLVSSLPQWPKNCTLMIVDGQGRSLISHPPESSTSKVIKVPEWRLRKGDLLYCLEDAMTAQEFDALLPARLTFHFSKIENLALRLSREAQQHNERVFSWLTGLSELATTPLEQELRRLAPDLSKSHLEEMTAVLSPSAEQRLVLEKSLTELQQWEANRYISQARASRAGAGIHMDAAGNAASAALIFQTLERFPGWPSTLRLEVHDKSIDGPLLLSSGAESNSTPRLLIRQGTRFRACDAEGNTVFEPTDLPTAIEHVLSTTELDALLTPLAVPTLKQAMSKTNLQLLAKKMLPPRATTSSEALPSGSGHPLDPLFAEPAHIQDLTQRADGTYQGAPLADGSYPYYVMDNGLYYHVKPDALGWQLIDARSRFRAYRPYIRKKTDGGWEIDELKGTLLGGMPPPPITPRTSTESSSGTFESAESTPSADDYLSADDDNLAVPYTPQELRHMRSDNSYQHSRNYLGIYDRANNGRYPLRDVDGQPMRIKFIGRVGKSMTSDRTISKNLVLPYIQWEGYEQVARLYDEKLEVQPFTSAHQKYPQEASLIGQAMVVARRRLKKDEVLGVYGGELVPAPTATYRQDPYLASIFTPNQASPGTSGHAPSTVIKRDVLLSGDNVLSRINTVFEYEGQQPVRQAPNGYNVEAVQFDVDTRKGNEPLERLRLTVLVASEDIPAGTELRWNYGYDETTIKRLPNTLQAP